MVSGQTREGLWMSSDVLLMGGFRCVQMGGLGVDMVCRYGGISRYRNESSTVMYNFGDGPRGDPLFTSF